MFLINLDDEYRITIDPLNYILERKVPMKEGSKKQAWTKTYYSNMGYLLRCYFEYKIKSDINPTDISSLEGYYSNVAAFLEEINSRISPDIEKRLVEIQEKGVKDE